MELAKLVSILSFAYSRTWWGYPGIAVIFAIAYVLRGRWHAPEWAYDIDRWIERRRERRERCNDSRLAPTESRQR